MNLLANQRAGAVLIARRVGNKRSDVLGNTRLPVTQGNERLLKETSLPKCSYNNIILFTLQPAVVTLYEYRIINTEIIPNSCLCTYTGQTLTHILLSGGQSYRIQLQSPPPFFLHPIKVYMHMFIQ